MPKRREPGGSIVDIPADEVARREARHNAAITEAQTRADQIRQALADGQGAVSREEVNRLKAFLRSVYSIE